jgi:hypothetical protein
VGCGGDPDTAPPDAAAGCHVELAGNSVETTTSPASCPSLVPGVGATQGGTILHFTIAGTALGGDLAIDVDLGPAPAPGSYASGTTELWSAMAVKEVPPGACVFLAGNNTTPAGYFTLALATLDPHGELALELAVLPRVEDDGAQTDCGPGTTEDVHIAF